MQDAVLNLCRVKLRDQQRLERVGYLEEYPQYPNGEFGDAVPRGGNAGGGGQPGWVLKCKGWETDPNAYIYFTIQEQNWERDVPRPSGRPEWVDDPAYSTARARQPTRSSTSSPRSRSGWPTRPSTRRSTSCASGRCLARRCMSMKEIAEDPDAAQERKRRRGGAEGPRHLPDRRQPDQVLGVQAGHQGRAAARRAHRRGPCRTGLRRGHHRKSGTRRRSSSEPGPPG